MSSTVVPSGNINVISKLNSHSFIYYLAPARYKKSHKIGLSPRYERVLRAWISLYTHIPMCAMLIQVEVPTLN